ncbi:MAG: hypothetical protein K2G69_02335 [Muribaculaceae bacterium]|nr:hypothetical protein [Muribaculaceae bacterium]
MEYISARDFSSNQTAILTRIKKGERIILNSEVGKFKVTPIREEDDLTERICRGIKQVKMIKEGKLPRRTIQDMLDEI